MLKNINVIIKTVLLKIEMSYYKQLCRKRRCYIAKSYVENIDVTNVTKNYVENTDVTNVRITNSDVGNTDVTNVFITNSSVENTDSH